MSYVRYYRMIAQEGEGSTLRAALEVLLGRVGQLSGCQAVELLQDASTKDVFVLLERWTTAEAHQESSKQLGKEAFAPILAVLSSPPQSAALITLD